MNRFLPKIILLLYGLISVLLVLLYFDVKFFSMYSNVLHIFSRTHILFVHTLFGFFPLMSIYFILKARSSSELSNRKVKRTLVVVLQLLIVLGILMVLIESYPSSYILFHLLFGLTTLVCYQVSVLIHDKNWKIRVSVHTLCIVSILITGHFGELIYRGIPIW